jgi:magnesium transporter
MIFACLNQETLTIHEITTHDQHSLKQAVWIDLVTPSKDEEHLIEECIGSEIPTRDEMVEIELSSRLYREGDTLYMTATMIAHSESEEPKFDPVTFVLTPRQLITIRYIDPQSFKLMISHLKKVDANHRDAISLLIELLDASIDRLADILELVGRHLDEYSKAIFHTHKDSEEKLDYQKLMQTIGSNGDLHTKTRESLMSFSRLIAYLSQAYSSKIDDEVQQRLAILTKDISSLTDHANFLSTKVNFLLDATLGMVNIEQNNIIMVLT